MILRYTDYTNIFSCYCAMCIDLILFCAICLTYRYFKMVLLCIFIFVSSLTYRVLKWQFALLSNCFKLCMVIVVCLTYIYWIVMQLYMYDVYCVCLTYNLYNNVWIVWDWDTIEDIHNLYTSDVVQFVYVWHIAV